MFLFSFYGETIYGTFFLAMLLWLYQNASPFQNLSLEFVCFLFFFFLIWRVH